MILVLGCGNPLRGDDAVGPLLARRVAAWGLPGVEAVDVHQLMPELAAPVSRAERVVVIDASAVEQGGAVEVTVVEPAARPQSLAHVADVAWVLALASELFGRAPPCQLVTVRAERFELGAPLSAGAAAALDGAERTLRELLAGPSERERRGPSAARPIG